MPSFFFSLSLDIDFGFMLSNSPGSVGFEMAPFKLPQEYIDILGGIHGEKFAEYKALMKAAFLSVRKHSENILLLVEMMCKDSKQGCFQSGEQTIHQLRDRFQLHLTEPQAEEFVDRLIMSSCGNVFTKLYDTYQYYSQVNIRGGGKEWGKDMLTTVIHIGNSIKVWCVCVWHILVDNKSTFYYYRPCINKL
jgi:phosphatidylinositol 4-kinase